MLSDILREITPLTASDCFTIFSREKEKFDFPLHNHEEMELNLILNANGAKRIIGDHIDEIGDAELVFVGPNLPHGWFTHKCKSKKIIEVTIQFHKDLIDDRFLKRNQMIKIRQLFEYSLKGVLFSQETIKTIAPKIIELSKKVGFESILDLFYILHILSISQNIKLLSDASFMKEEAISNSRRIEKVLEFLNTNFSREIKLSDAAKIANMPETSFSRFIKQRTGYTFIDCLTAIRLGHVTRMLIDTTHSIAEIAYLCGFNNMANFNKTFKNKKGCTPKEFRDNYAGNRIFI